MAAAVAMPRLGLTMETGTEVAVLGVIAVVGAPGENIDSYPGAGGRRLELTPAQRVTAAGMSESTTIPQFSIQMDIPMETAIESAKLIESAHAGSLAPDDLTGATFTGTNLGMFGVTSFVPLVPPGQSSIPAVGAIGENPPRRTAFTLTCDHRAVNGATAGRFLQALASILKSGEPGVC